MTTPHQNIAELVAVLARLRAPGGCVWDAEQTHESLVRYLIEETYELVDAIESGDRDAIVEELGDVLYQVIFHADIGAAQTGAARFDLEDVAAGMTAKMIGRHPHVFADANADTAEEVVALWDEVKAVEKSDRTSVLDGIPNTLPSLQLADKVIGRARRVGVFPGGVDECGAPGSPPAGVAASDRVVEGVGSPQTTRDETVLGHQLLAIVANARERGLDSERALREAVRQLRTAVRTAENAAETIAENTVEEIAETTRDRPGG